MLAAQRPANPGLQAESNLIRQYGSARILLCCIWGGFTGRGLKERLVGREVEEFFVVNTVGIPITVEEDVVKY